MLATRNDAPERSLARKPKLLVLTSTFPRWKNDREPPFVLELCRRLAETFHVHVIAPHANKAKRREILCEVEVTRFRYCLSRWETLTYEGGITARLKEKPARCVLVPLFLVAELVATVRALRNDHYEAIHAHWLIPQGAIAILARTIARRKVPILCTSHGGDLYALRGRWWRAAKRFVISQVETLTVVSHAMENTLHEIAYAGNKILVIPMGIDLSQRFTPPETPRTSGSLLFAGRLVEKKGLVYLIEAMRTIAKKYPYARLIIAGGGPDRQSMTRLVEQFGLSHHVSFLGAVTQDQLSELYRSSELVIFPSVQAEDGDEEGFGLVAVEAMGCECAVIGTDLPALKESLIDGQTGIVVEQRNPSTLAKSIMALLGNSERRTRLGVQARAFVLTRYDWPIIAERYVEVIQNLRQQKALTQG